MLLLTEKFRNILWVLIACLLTVIDSLTSTIASSSGGSGFAATALWSYLLVLVISWLNVGSQPEANHLRTALEESNVNAWVATAQGPIPVSDIAGRPSRAIEYPTRPTTRVQNDERRTAPIFNYSRVFLWSQQGEMILQLYENASEKADQKITVSGCDWIPTEHGVDRRNRAAGTDAQVIGYCHSIDSDDQSIPELLELRPISSAGAHAKYDTGLPSHFSQGGPHRPLWASHIFERVAFAITLALILQWGSTGAGMFLSCLILVVIQQHFQP